MENKCEQMESAEGRRKMKANFEEVFRDVVVLSTSNIQTIITL
jgi:hypothetical protein